MAIARAVLAKFIKHFYFQSIKSSSIIWLFCCSIFNIVPTPTALHAHSTCCHPELSIMVYGSTPYVGMTREIYKNFLSRNKPAIRYLLRRFPLIFNFHFQLHISCYSHLQHKCIVHRQCLFQLDGSILAGVLTLSCVVPESHIPPTQQVAAY